jgi:ABC-type phosphate transport system permease subunit
MSAVLESTPLQATLRHRSIARRKATDLVIKVLSWIGAWLGIAVMFFIVWEVVVRGVAALDWAFFTQATGAAGAARAGEEKAKRQRAVEVNTESLSIHTK